MLDLQNLSLQLGNGEEAPLLLSDLSARFPTGGHFAAILGPSGCGKSTLLKVVAGLLEPTAGEIHWKGQNLSEKDLEPSDIGYVPQFSIAYDLLTVRESLDSAFRLRVAGLGVEEREARVEGILTDVGLADIADRRVQVLSGGQKRRLALALEMVSAPRLLLCDEVTSGLDPKAESEVAQLLVQLARGGDRLVLSVTHSLQHLSLCDSVVVLYQGQIAYHGAPEFLFHYFDVERHEDLFPRLAQRAAEDWHRSWQKNRESYYQQSKISPAAEEVEPVHAAHPLPSLGAQASVLLARRCRLFFRDRGQLFLQLALLLGFPCLVVIFALDGLPQLKSFGDGSGNLLQSLQNAATRQVEMIRTGSLVSGLVMFQVILLSLMGANNGAREIAGERAIFEKEKFAGLSPLAYVASKAAFLAVLVVLQSVWMAIFVNWVVRFPGSLFEQAALLTLVNASMTAVCLAISSWMRSAEQSSLVSIYLVGFQLPLSGAVLAMPAALHSATHWFIASYWGWSGFLQTLRDTRFYDAVQQVAQTRLAPVPFCLWVLACHVALGLYLAYAGCRNPRWN